jgi:hypothetical protein
MKVFFVSFLLVLSFNLHSQNSSSFLQQLSAGEGLTSEETTIYNTIVGNDRVTDHMIISVQSPTNGIFGENYFAVNIPATMISAEESLNSEWQGPLVIHISSSGKTITTSIILQK